MGEFCAVYGPPDPSMPWPLFQLLTERLGRFSARRILEVMHGTAWGAARVFSKDAWRLDQAQRDLERVAYPPRAGTSDLDEVGFRLMQQDATERPA